MDWRKQFLLVLIILLPGMVAGDVYYEVDANADRVLFNTTVKLECQEGSCPVDSWSLTLDKPENATVTGVEALQGELVDYSVHGNKILIQTEAKGGARSETVVVSYTKGKDAEEVEKGLYSRVLNLPGFGGEANSGSVHVDDLIATSATYGFQTREKDDNFKFKGTGPTNVKVSFGKGYETDYYEFFGDRPKNTNMANEVAVGTLGFSHRSGLLPVAVISGERYNNTVNNWSAGQYIRGNIVMREGLENDLRPVLAHETVHALNDQRLKWDTSSSTWFDEGVSKYVEFLMKKRQKGQQATRELFGKKISYVDREAGKRYRYSLPPKGDKDVLWQYYRSNSSSMMHWNSQSGGRRFGYAYSELIIRNYVSKNNSLSQLYEKLQPGREISSDREKWRYYSQYLDLTPCKFESRKKFEACLDRVNSYNYPIYTAEPDNTSQKELEVERLEVPNNTGVHARRVDNTRESGQLNSVLFRVISDFRDLIQELATSL